MSQEPMMSFPKEWILSDEEVRKNETFADPDAHPILVSFAGRPTKADFELVDKMIADRKQRVIEEAAEKEEADAAAGVEEPQRKKRR